MGGPRMDERHESTVCPGTRLRIDQVQAVCAQALHLRPDVGNDKGKVVEPFPSSLDEPSDDPVPREGLE